MSPLGRATKRLLSENREETGIFAPVVFLGKFSHHDKPENQIVAVFVCKSDTAVTIDQAEATDARFYSKEEVDRIVASEKVTPWLRDGWLMTRDKI